MVPPRWPRMPCTWSRFSLAERDPAERLLWRLTLVRLLGVVLAVAGLAVVGLAPLGEVSRFAGLALLLLGAGIVAFGKRLLRP